MNRLFCFWLVLVASPVFGEIRTWNDSAGEHTFKAELIRANRDSFGIKLLDNGKEYDLPIRIMCKADQDYIRKQYNAVMENRKHVSDMKATLDGLISGRSARADEMMQRAAQAREDIRQSKERQKILEQQLQELQRNRR